MILLFDACSSRGYIGLYHDRETLVGEEYFFVQGNESSKIIQLIHDFLQKYSISYEILEKIICVNGPGSFTGIRTITLVVNTLAFMYPNIFLSPVNYFDLFDGYPIVKQSSKRDLFVKYEKGDIIHIVTNTDFQERVVGGSIYGDVNSERFTNQYELYSDIDYKRICSSMILQKMKKIAPLYIKKPNIS